MDAGIRPSAKKVFPSSSFLALSFFFSLFSTTSSFFFFLLSLLYRLFVATYVAGGDAKGLGNALVQLLHVRKVADLLGRRAVCQLAVKHHVKLLGGHLRTGGRGGDGTTLPRHGSGVFLRGRTKGLVVNGGGMDKGAGRSEERMRMKSGKIAKREEIGTYIFCHVSSGEVGSWRLKCILGCSKCNSE